jgi:hypothetical protein
VYLAAEQSVGQRARALRWKAPRFTGGRYPSRGAGGTWASVGPSSFAMGLFPCGRTHRRQRVSEGRRGWERRPHVLLRRMHRTRGRIKNATRGRSKMQDASFTRSFGTCASIVTTLRRARKTSTS